MNTSFNSIFQRDMMAFEFYEPKQYTKKYIKNPEKFLDANINGWTCNGANTIIEKDTNEITYEFNFWRQKPVINSPYRTWHTMARDEHTNVKIKLLSDGMIEFNNDGCVEYLSDWSIETMANFIELLENKID